MFVLYKHSVYTVNKLNILHIANIYLYNIRSVEVGRNYERHDMSIIRLYEVLEGSSSANISL